MLQVMQLMQTLQFEHTIKRPENVILAARLTVLIRDVSRRCHSERAAKNLTRWQRDSSLTAQNDNA